MINYSHNIDSMVVKIDSVVVNNEKKRGALLSWFFELSYNIVGR